MRSLTLTTRLIKDIVTETETFDIETFIPLLQKHIKRTKPYIRQLLVSWIMVLNTVPDINMLDYLPDFLDGLFNMLSDGNKEIKNAAENALSQFLKEIRDADVVELGPMINILVSHCGSKDKSGRLTALAWLTDFILIGGSKLLMFYASVLGSIMYCISDQEADIQDAAKSANSSLMELVKTSTEVFELKSLLIIVTAEILSEHVSTRMTALSWIYMLHEKAPEDINKNIGEILPALLKTLSDNADEVVLLNLQVMARISLDNTQFMRVLNAIVQLFLEDRMLLESRGALIVRKLCSLLDCTNIYVTLSTIILERTELDFCSLFVQTLNLILLTAPELAPLRIKLKDCFQAATRISDRQIFVLMFKSWCHNSVATFSLCLLAQVYDLSSCLIQKFAQVDVTVGFLMQIDKLVQLLESPIFINLRLQLLEVNSNYHSDLLKSLYGLLMLLPQSQAYKTLSDRLATVSSLQIHMGIDRTYRQSGNKVSNGTSTIIEGVEDEGHTKIDYNYLLNKFESTQSKHLEFRLSLIQRRSLLVDASPEVAGMLASR